MKYACDRKFSLLRYRCAKKIIKLELGSDKVIAKIKWCSLLTHMLHK